MVVMRRVAQGRGDLKTGLRTQRKRSETHSLTRKCLRYRPEDAGDEAAGVAGTNGSSPDSGGEDAALAEGDPVRGPYDPPVACLMRVRGLRLENGREICSVRRVTCADTYMPL